MKRHGLSAGSGAPQTGIAAGVMVSLGRSLAQPSRLKCLVADNPKLKTIMRFFNSPARGYRRSGNVDRIARYAIEIPAISCNKHTIACMFHCRRHNAFYRETTQENRMARTIGSHGPK